MSVQPWAGVADTWPLLVLAAVVGLAVGSFLNVVVHRVPAGASVVHPPSACPTCASPVAARDDVPVVSWLLLRGRCRSCAAPISVRHPLVELATAGLFAAVTAWVAHEGRWALLGGLLLYGHCFALALAAAEPGGMGFGDVKLAGVLGAVLGCAGWSALAVGAFAAFVIGGLVGVALVATGVLRRRGHLPFGPFMLAGAALGVVGGGGVVHWYLAMSGYPLA